MFTPTAIDKLLNSILKREENAPPYWCTPEGPNAWKCNLCGGIIVVSSTALIDDEIDRLIDEHGIQHLKEHNLLPFA